MVVTVWVCAAVAQVDTVRWHGTLRDAKGNPLPAAEIELLNGGQPARVRTAADGQFDFTGLAPGEYSVRVGQGPSALVQVAAGAAKAESIRVSADGSLTFESPADAAPEATGGGQLSGKQVSALPLNKRDFSQLLLLAAGTQTDTNGAANFTQQFTVNGQRGTATVFAMDGIDTTDPEMGGATFSNFNVDAIQEVTSDAGVMKAEIGHGAARFTERHQQVRCQRPSWQRVRVRAQRRLRRPQLLRPAPR